VTHRDLHPSFLELDRLALNTGAAETERHTASCAACAAHLRTIRLSPTAAPAWARRPSRPRIPFLPTFGALAAVCAASVVFILVPREDDALAVRAKAAAPSVAVYVKRGDRVSLWDGLSPLQAGDAVRLEVTPSGYTHLWVTTPVADAGARARVLYRGELPPAGTTVLPVSWRLDGDSGAEVLDVTLAKRPLDDLESTVPPTDVWKTRLVLPRRRSL